MRTLFLLRHAKASRESPTRQDFDRPLDERGHRDARLIGEFMLKERIAPAVVLCSPAERTKQTSALVIDTARLVAPVRYEPGIYEASMPDLLEIIAGTEESMASVLLVGHNPGIEDLLGQLTGGGGAKHMKTAAFAEITLDGATWSEMPNHSSRRGQLKRLVTPASLADQSA